MADRKEKTVKQIIEPLSIEALLRLKGFRLTNKHLGDSSAVWENKDEQLAIVFYEM